MRMAATAYYNAPMVRALPDDGQRYETVWGELLVTPAPQAWHQEIVVRLITALRAYLDENWLGHCLASPADISWGPDTLVQPDVFVVELDEAKTMDWSKMRTLPLAIEVLSPSTARQDRFIKRRLYQEVGIPLYWIVDLDNQLVEVWTPDDRFPGVERERIVWKPSSHAPPFTLSLGKLFKPL